jgi:hypothetical protein
MISANINSKFGFEKHHSDITLRIFEKYLKPFTLGIV